MGLGAKVGDQAALRAYFEANRVMLGLKEEINTSIVNTFLGVAIWGGLDHRDDPLTMQELSTRIGLPYTTVSRHLRYLGELERQGKPGLDLVTTEIYHLNRRMKVTELTHKGKAIRDRIVYALGAGDAGTEEVGGVAGRG